MECNRDEAARAKTLAERKMLEKDFVGAKKMINKVQQLFRQVDDIDIPKMLTVCDVHCAAGAKVNNEIDWYGILQVPVNADDTLIKKQYRKLALLLHPDKNKFGGAEAAFKLVGEANITLTDRSKRSVHDMKRNTFRSVKARPNHQPPKRPAPARSSSTPVHLHNMHQQHQHQASNPTGPQTTFWTICPACGMRYQYYLSILKKALRCQNCLKPFIAHDLKDQAIPAGANQRSAGVWKNAGAPHNFSGPQSNVTGQKNWSATPEVHVNSDSHHANVNIKRETDVNTGGLKNRMKSTRGTRNSSKASTAGLKRGRRAAFESSESSISETSSDSKEEILKHGPSVSSAGPAQQTRRSSRQKQEVKYNEDSDDDRVEDDGDTVKDDFVGSPALKKLRKSGLFHGDHSTKSGKLNEDTAGHDGLGNCSNIKDTENGGKTSSGVEQMKRETMHAGVNSDGKEEIFHSVSNNGLGLNDGEASDDNKFAFPDPEFFDFDKLRDASQFRANQVWAVYDDQGCMPRFYARITRVKMIPKFMLDFVWLEFNPANKAEEAWSHRGLPVACGHFKHGQSERTEETGMFSRTISFHRSKAKNLYEIYPRKGEVWALFKGWDIGWSLDAGSHKKLNHHYQYDVVQVLSDLTTSTSIIVMPLVRIKGYVSLFMQSGEAAPYVIPQGDTLRFSHCVPHHMMSGTEKEGIPEGSLELDPAALPFNLEEAFPSAKPECSSARSQVCDSRHAGVSSGNCKGSMYVGQGQHTTCVNAGIPTNTQNEENMKHNTHLPEVTVINDDDDDDDNICQTEYVCAESEFYDFSGIRSLQRFCSGQIWALYSDIDKFPNYYAFIQKVDLKNNKIQVRWLDVCPQGEVEKRLSQERTISIGTFRLSSVHEMVTYTGTDAFSHTVEAISTGRKGEYEILPRLGEIWAVYKNWRAGWTAQDFEKCEYELVEIFGYTDSSIQVQLVRKVDGYKMVFMPYRGGGVKTIRKHEYPKFSHQIPCFHLTHQNGGQLRGYFELDPLSLPEEFLC